MNKTKILPLSVSGQGALQITAPGPRLSLGCRAFGGRMLARDTGSRVTTPTQAQSLDTKENANPVSKTSDSKKRSAMTITEWSVVGGVGAIGIGVLAFVAGNNVAGSISFIAAMGLLWTPLIKKMMS